MKKILNKIRTDLLMFYHNLRCYVDYEHALFMAYNTRSSTKKFINRANFEYGEAGKKFAIEYSEQCAIAYEQFYIAKSGKTLPAYYIHLLRTI